MVWINFLHLYQPANTDFANIQEALDKSYWRLIRLLEEHPDLKFTFNISGCLLSRLQEKGEKDFVRRLKNLLKRGQIELTGSAAYHGFLPLLPEEEVVWQIKENEKILKDNFGVNLKLRGFFLPEMAYSPAVAKVIKKMGYDWLILDEIAYSGIGKKRPKFDRCYIDQSSGLKIVFRDRKLSSGYAPDKLKLILNKVNAERLKGESQDTVYLLTATDSELYGLRHEDPTAELEGIVKMKEINTLTVSGLLKFTERQPIEKIKVYTSSWESSVKDIKTGQPFRLWLDKKNKIQVSLWKMAYLCLEVGRKFKKDQNYFWYRWHLSRGLASCTFWWASANDFSYIFGPYAWNPDVVEKGLDDLVRSVRSLMNPKSRKHKLLVEKYYAKIKGLIWEEHWKKHW